MGLHNLKQRYSPQRLLQFFLVCAFPFHLWAILMLIRDIGWIIERSGTGSFIGVASLTMVYALVESLLLFLILLVLSLFIPWNWSPERAFTILGFLAILIPIGDMLAQVYRAANLANPNFVANWLFSTGHPLRYGYPLLILASLVLVALFAAGIWLVCFNQKFQKIIQNILDRVVVLSALYLLLDLAGFVVILFRILG